MAGFYLKPVRRALFVLRGEDVNGLRITDEESNEVEPDNDSTLQDTTINDSSVSKQSPGIDVLAHKKVSSAEKTFAPSSTESLKQNMNRKKRSATLSPNVPSHYHKSSSSFMKESRRAATESPKVPSGNNIYSNRTPTKRSNTGSPKSPISISSNSPDIKTERTSPRSSPEKNDSSDDKPTESPTLIKIGIKKRRKDHKLSTIFEEKRTEDSLSESSLDFENAKPTRKTKKALFSSDSSMDEIETPINSINFEEDDSDIEPGDDSAFTEKRLACKRARHMPRDKQGIKLFEKEDNKVFIEDMESFMQNNNISTGNKSNSTITKALRELFYSEDSLLCYEVNQNEDFNLQKWRMFNSSSFVSLNYPLHWITESCGENGGRALERLKAHAALRSYIKYEVDKYDSSLDFLSIKQTVNANLESISKQITTGRLYNNYTKLATNYKQKCDRAKLILDPSLNQKINNCVKVWNNSLEKEELDKDNRFIYEQAIKSKSISPANFTKYSNYARMMLCFSDRSRQGAYAFKFQDYLDKLPQYYPEDYDGFNSLPLGWDPNTEPDSDAEPSVYIIMVSGIILCHYIIFCPLILYT